MKKIYGSILLFILPLLTVTAQYKFDYKLKLNNKASTYNESITIKTDSSNQGIIKFDVENSDELKINNITILVKGKKTLSSIKTDSLGKAIINLQPGLYTFIIKGEGYNELILKDVEINPNFNIKYGVNLGTDSKDKIAKLRCSKKLSEKQIEGIIKDISKGKHDSELIKCRICFLSFE